jgi:hypothetical protein
VNGSYLWLWQRAQPIVRPIKTVDAVSWTYDLNLLPGLYNPLLTQQINGSLSETSGA